MLYKQALSLALLVETNVSFIAEEETQLANCPVFQGTSSFQNHWGNYSVLYIMSVWSSHFLECISN